MSTSSESSSKAILGGVKEESDDDEEDLEDEKNMDVVPPEEIYQEGVVPDKEPDVSPMALYRQAYDALLHEQKQPGEDVLPALEPVNLLGLSKVTPVPSAPPLVQNTPPPRRVVAPAPWGRVVYFVTVLAQTLDLKVEECFASYRFQLFIEAFTRANPYASRVPLVRDNSGLLVSTVVKSNNAAEAFLRDHCELLISRVVKRVNWCIEKALLMARTATTAGILARPLSLYDIISDNDCLVYFTSLCSLFYFDIAVQAGAKFMPLNATRLDDLTKCNELKFFAQLSRFPRRNTHAELEFEIRAEDTARFTALQRIASSVQLNSESPDVPRVLIEQLRSFEKGPVVKKEPVGAALGGLSRNPDFVLFLLGIVPEGELELGLPKTAYFLRLLSQAANKSKKEDLDFDITDLFPAYHTAAVIEKSGPLAHSLTKSCVIIKELCPLTLRDKNPNQTLEWLCRDRIRLVQGVRFVVCQYSLFTRILKRRAAGMNPLTSRRIHDEMLRVAMWFRSVYK